MKLITYYTNTHRILYEKFLTPSINDDFEVISKMGEQVSIDGSYFSDGFNESTKNKIIFLLSELKKTKDNEMVLFCDVDIIFISDVKSYLEKYLDYDMVFQNAYHGLNTGFFILKNNSNVQKLLSDVITNCHKYHDDQVALNDLIINSNIKYTIFDDRILSPAPLNNIQIWKGEILKFPEDTIVFHACWCAGIENKIKLLNYAKENFRVEAK
jgi:hypothetical protein